MFIVFFFCKYCRIIIVERVMMMVSKILVVVLNVIGERYWVVLFVLFVYNYISRIYIYMLYFLIMKKFNLCYFIKF